MRKLTCVYAVSAVLVVLTGCATVTGDWTLKKIKPPSARHRFDICRVTFNVDGTYEAELAGQGEPRRVRGTYKFEPRSRRLTLTATDGQQRRYYAERCTPCGYMTISSAENPGAWEAVLIPTPK